eukprot:scaffold90296_cov68-Phaeocystis_antarctica.AAC.19
MLPSTVPRAAAPLALEAPGLAALAVLAALAGGGPSEIVFRKCSLPRDSSSATLEGISISTVPRCSSSSPPPRPPPPMPPLPPPPLTC